MTPTERERVRRYVEALDLRRVNLGRELEDEIAPLRALDMRERGRWVASVCRSAWSILRSRSDWRTVIESRQPPAADFDGLWRSLAARRRSRG